MVVILYSHQVLRLEFQLLAKCLPYSGETGPSTSVEHAIMLNVEVNELEHNILAFTEFLPLLNDLVQFLIISLLLMHQIALFKNHLF